MSLNFSPIRPLDLTVSSICLNSWMYVSSLAAFDAASSIRSIIWWSSLNFLSVFLLALFLLRYWLTAGCVISIFSPISFWYSPYSSESVSARSDRAAGKKSLVIISDSKSIKNITGL